jgi:bifunctional damage-control phosphatase, subfamily II, fusion protein
MEEPAAYGKFGLANLLELREECLREFQFVDAYISIKQRLPLSPLGLWAHVPIYLMLLVFSAWRENEASLAVLPDLLMELDSMNKVSAALLPSELYININSFEHLVLCDSSDYDNCYSALVLLVDREHGKV